jgi:glucose-1-phosphate thymidylyltransferase
MIKVIIPVAGIGSKLRPHTHTQPKSLVPVAGKAILSHIVEYLMQAGFTDFVFVIGYLGEKIEEHIKDKYPDLKASFVLQSPREGTGHAIWTARDYIQGDNEMLIVLGDTIFDFDFKSVINENISALAVKKVDDPRTFGVVELNDAGIITKLVEKPKMPKSNLALAGVYYIKEGAFLMKCLDQMISTGNKTNDEYTLTDAIMAMVTEGIKLKTFQIGNWMDCGSRLGLLSTNATMLKRLKENTEIKYRFPNTIVIEPVSIAENCRISDSIIGPNVSIGEHTIISTSIISDSIIGSYSQLETATLHHSVIGSDAYLKGFSQSLNIGDSTEIDFS